MFYEMHYQITDSMTVMFFDSFYDRLKSTLLIIYGQTGPIEAGTCHVGQESRARLKLSHV